MKSWERFDALSSLDDEQPPIVIDEEVNENTEAHREFKLGTGRNLGSLIRGVKVNSAANSLCKAFPRAGF